MTTATQYAKGKLAKGVCQRCGLWALLNDLVFDGYYRNLRVHPECRDSRHPQERLVKVSDPQTLWRPSPEAPGIPPALSGEIV